MHTGASNPLHGIPLPLTNLHTTLHLQHDAQHADPHPSGPGMACRCNVVPSCDEPCSAHLARLRRLIPMAPDPDAWYLLTNASCLPTPSVSTALALKPLPVSAAANNTAARPALQLRRFGGGPLMCLTVPPKGGQSNSSFGGRDDVRRAAGGLDGRDLSLGTKVF